MAKTIAVVGAGPLVGLAVAERFGAEGFNVALIARNAKKLEEYVAKLKGMGIKAAAFPADVLDRPMLVRALELAKEKFGPIDVLYYGPTPDWRPESSSPRMMDVENEQLHLDYCVLGAIAATRAVLPDMLAQHKGTLLFGSAASSHYPVAFTAVYGVAAGAALNYVRVLNQDLGADGIFAGIVSVAGMVVQRGEGKPESVDAFGLPMVPAQDVADIHWRLYTERKTPEVFAGDIKGILALAGLSGP